MMGNKPKRKWELSSLFLGSVMYVTSFLVSKQSFLEFVRKNLTFSILFWTIMVVGTIYINTRQRLVPPEMRLPEMGTR